MKPKLLLVKWQDAEATLDWMPISEMKPGEPIVYSVGWKTFENKDVIRLSADIGADPTANRHLDIPKKLIKSRNEIKLVARKVRKVGLKKRK